MFNKLRGLFRKENLWNLQAPNKRGGSYSIYYGEKHIANVRGKTKAYVLIDALHGVDSTENLVQ